MCIRDSADSGAGRHQAVVNLPPEEEFVPDTIELAVPVENCLLYTSDAADERSSVDLGGRRIIKKKTSLDYKSRSRDRHTHNTTYQ